MAGKKKGDKEAKAQARRDKKEARVQKMNNAGGEEEYDDCDQLNNQLLGLGLSLKIIPGDGNCLFRALGDQLDGNFHDHLHHRKSVVEYMLEHRDDFEPFVEDDISFDQHIRNLSEPGTFGGNDSLVAFARLHNLTIVIHQLDKPAWQVQYSPADGGGTSDNRSRELHISYHNGDHYNSVRRCEDVNGTGPAMVHLSRLRSSAISNSPPPSDGRRRKQYYSSHNATDDFSNGEENEGGVESDYENTPSARDLQRLVIQVKQLSKITNEDRIMSALEANDYSPQAAAKSLQYSSNNNMSRGASRSNSELWSQNGTGSRIIGNQIINNPQQHSSKPPPPPSEKKLTAKQQKELKKKQKRLEKATVKKPSAAENSAVNNSLAPQLKTLTI
eukprot:TRINITY_DN732_c0_g1_i11.p1 TRINITY_DN732_c0_g1~~TRINITY_DN732_c0_g1_i11.p1  ORF type:complete len:387 (-),score=72.24 TRINITY_DN732_c0_g1_i11:409-1569(-)